MEILVVGIGALGGVIASRLIAAGVPVSLATRTRESAERLRSDGLSVTGIGPATAARPERVAALHEITTDSLFDLVVVATKAKDAILAAPTAMRLLREGGTLLPIQNGAVSEILAGRFGPDHVLGGLSNLGATMIRPGIYEQRNAGHLLIGEIGGGASERVERVRAALARGVDTRTTENMRGAVWSKLLLNCSVTTIGAIAGTTMREYIRSPIGRTLFDCTYRESLAVALAAGATPARMIVEPVPPADAEVCEAWLQSIVAAYGEIKPSMLQDFEHRRETEVEFINGYIAALGDRIGISTPFSDALVEVIEAITRGEASPDPTLMNRVADSAFGTTCPNDQSGASATGVQR